jgi:uncharacterized protein
VTFKHILFILAILCVQLVCAGTKIVTKPYFYEIQKNGQKSYLLGTLHLGIRFDELPSVVAYKIFAADIVAVEIKYDIEYLQKVRTNSEKYILESFAAGWAKGLYKSSDMLNAKQIAAYVAAGAPPYVAGVTPNSTCSYFSAYPKYVFPHFISLDHEIVSLAYSQKKPIIELDANNIRLKAEKLMPSKTCTLESQGVFDRKKQIALETKFNMRLDAYRSGNYEPYFVRKKSVEFRNQHWMKLLLPELEKQSVFIAVGANHLYGPVGLIQLLREKGYTVERISR